jgi:hypothetical protein
MYKSQHNARIQQRLNNEIGEEFDVARYVKCQRAKLVDVSHT